MNSDVLTSKPTLADAEEIMKTLFSGVLVNTEYVRFLTGSLAFGEEGPNSDIDIAVPIMFKNATQDNIQLAKATGQSGDYVVEESEYNDGIRFTIHRASGTESIGVNLIFLHPTEYVAWYRATALYRKLGRKHTKSARHVIFETLRAVVKMSLVANGTEIDPKNYAVHIVAG